MTILCWNCRGPSNPQAVRELCREVKEKSLEMVFCMETKLRSNKMAIIKQKLGFKNMLVVDSIGRSGGLALLWKDEVGVEVPNYSQRHINAIVKPPNLNKLTFTGFYGHPKTHRRKAWGLLKYLKSMELGP
jgi:hypothetical protein